jgi:hypothetical protein
MNQGLINFLLHYNLYIRHGSLRKELKVKMPFNAIEKWSQLAPEIFTETTEIFKKKLLNLNQLNEQVVTNNLVKLNN